MKDEGGVLNAWKDRVLFALVAAALAVHVLWSALVAAGPSVPAAGSDEGGQRYVLAAGMLALPADADAVFARAESDAYFDVSLGRVWVKPKAEAVQTVLRLDPPPPAVPAPPMLLPVPGPTLEFASGLPRWPQVPAEVLPEEEPVEEEAEAAAKEPAKGRPAARPRPARTPEARPERPGRRREGKERIDPDEGTERLRRIRDRLKRRRERRRTEGEPE